MSRDLERWRGTERRIADDLGGNAQPGSGNQANYRGDVRVHGELRVQEKTVLHHRSTSLKVDDWEEVRNQALRTGEMPVLVFRFVESGHMLAMVSYDDFLEFVEMKRERDA